VLWLDPQVEGVRGHRRMAGCGAVQEWPTTRGEGEGPFGQGVCKEGMSETSVYHNDMSIPPLS